MAVERYRRALTTFEQAGLNDEAADCHLSLAALHLDQAEVTEAADHAEKARALELGSTVDLARTDLFRAELLCNRGCRRDQLSRALDLAIPALLFVDGQRVQFLTSTARRFWHNTFERSLAMVFDWAHRLGDAQTLCALVEVTVNVGVYTCAPESEDFASPYPTGYRNVAAAHRSRRLSRRAVLPIRPAPRRLMPDGTEALARYFEELELRYDYTSAADRTPIRNW